MASYSLPLGQSSVIRRPSALARSPPPPPPRAAGVPRFRVTGAPRGRAPDRRRNYKLICYYYVHARWAIGYVITYRQFTDYTYFIYTSYRRSTPGDRPIATSGPLRSVSGCARYVTPARTGRGPRPGSAQRRVLWRERGLLEVLGRRYRCTRPPEPERLTACCNYTFAPPQSPHASPTFSANLTSGPIDSEYTSSALSWMPQLRLG